MPLLLLLLSIVNNICYQQHTTSYNGGKYINLPFGPPGPPRPPRMPRGGGPRIPPRPPIGPIGPMFSGFGVAFFTSTSLPEMVCLGVLSSSFTTCSESNVLISSSLISEVSPPTKILPYRAFAFFGSTFLLLITCSLTATTLSIESALL
uniref:Uncharacterized protein n=1 Tax=Anopheles merus TaxID=30066 RepID=A0A182UQ70_ANOME